MSVVNPLDYHPSFPQPADPTVLVWRYTSLSKLLSLLTSRAIYLRRLDLLPDKYEGLFPRSVRHALAQHLATQGIATDEAIKIANHRVDFAKEAREMMYVNCWRMGNHESEAMWRIYCGGDNGLALVLPYHQLRTAITTGSTWLGVVRYLDYETDLLVPGNAFDVTLHKRREFSHEAEARIVGFGNQEFSEPSKRPVSISIPFEIDAIAKIIVSPYASIGFTEMLRQVVGPISSSLAAKIVPSSMAGEPG